MKTWKETCFQNKHFGLLKSFQSSNVPNSRNYLGVSEQTHASILIIKANTLLFIMCIFIHQLQRVGTVLGATRKNEENQNQLAKSLQGTLRDDIR